MSSPADTVRKYIQPGQRVGGRYQVERFVGAGAYGAIFAAIDVETMERVAIKALPPSTEGTNKTALGRFQREMKVISRMRHPNIITLYDFGETEHRIVYMILEFIDGQTLYDVATTEHLNDATALDITLQIASALAVAHDQKVVHRDLKPQNVMVVDLPNGEKLVKVLDFGMAKRLQGADDSAIMQLTREGVAVGTPRYIAPEQARGKDVGPWSDLYALGLLMYEIFTGERAVKADTIESAIIAHVSPEPLELAEIESVPNYVRPVLFKLIEKKVKRRYQNAHEVIKDLNRLAVMSKAMDAAPTLPVGSAALEIDENALRPKRPTGQVQSIHSADNLELDYDRYGRYPQADGEHVPSAREGRTGNFSFRAPQNLFEWLETFAAFALWPVAFTLFTAQFTGAEFIVRFALGIIPSILAISVAVLSKTPDWNFSFFRLLFFSNVVLIILAHVMGLDALFGGLLRNAAWYLEPFDDLPGISALKELIVSFSRAYALLWVDNGPAALQR